MDRVAVVLRAQWLAYWRRLLRTGPASKGNVGVLLFLGAIAVFRYLRYLPTLHVELGLGRAAAYEELLSAMFLVWLLPVLAESRRSLSGRGLIHFPLSVTEQFLVRLGSVFISPVSWALVLCSLALCYPLSAAPHFIPSVVALLLLLFLALSVALLVSDVVQGVKVRTVLVVGATTGLMVLAAYGVVGVTLPPQALAASAAVSPHPWRSVAALGLMTVVALWMCMRTYADSLRYRSRRRSWSRSTGVRLEIPGRLGALIQKDLRYWRRSLDLYFVAPIAIVTGIYLVAAPAPSRLSVVIAAVVLFIPLSSVAFNCFGFEKVSGFDRYSLLPLSGRDILFGKNLAWTMIMTATCLAILPFALWRVGFAASAVAGIDVALLGLAYLSWGNWMSVTHPVRTEPYRLSSGGPIMEAVLGLLFGSLPGALAVILAAREHSISIWAIAGLLPVYAFLYLRTLAWYGQRLEQRWSAIRESLS